MGLLRVRVVIAFVTLALAAGLAACQGNEDKGSTSSASGREPELGEAEATAPSVDQGTDDTVAGEGVSAGLGQPGTGREEGVLRGFGEMPDEADTRAIDAAVREYLAAVRAGDAEGACSVTSNALRKHLNSFGREGGGPGCGELVLTAFGNFSGESLRLLSRAQVTKVRIKGNHALAAYSVPGPRWNTLPMEREGGEWKVGKYGDWSGTG